MDTVVVAVISMNAVLALVVWVIAMLHSSITYQGTWIDHVVPNVMAPCRSTQDLHRPTLESGAHAWQVGQCRPLLHYELATQREDLLCSHRDFHAVTAARLLGLNDRSECSSVNGPNYSVDRMTPPANAHERAMQQASQRKPLTWTPTATTPT